MGGATEGGIRGWGNIKVMSWNSKVIVIVIDIRLGDKGRTAKWYLLETRSIACKATIRRFYCDHVPFLPITIMGLGPKGVENLSPRVEVERSEPQHYHSRVLYFNFFFYLWWKLNETIIKMTSAKDIKSQVKLGVLYPNNVFCAQTCTINSY